MRFHQYIPSYVHFAGIALHGRSDADTPGAESAASHMSERAAAIEAAALEVVAQLAEKQRELNRRRREAALAAKAALVEQMKASIAEIDSEIQVCFMVANEEKTQEIKTDAKRHQFSEKPRIIPGCPGMVAISLATNQG